MDTIVLPWLSMYSFFTDCSKAVIRLLILFAFAFVLLSCRCQVQLCDHMLGNG